MEDVDVLVISETERTVQMFITDPVLVSFISFMMLWFVISLFGIYNSYGSITRRFEKVRKEMIKEAGLKSGSLERVVLTEGLSDAWGEIFKRHRLQALWTAFDSNIIVYRGSGFMSMPHSYLKECFSADAIEKDHIPLRLGRRATFLISIGVLGTFLGLALGVNEAASGLASPNVRIARAALTDLLDGAGLAFITSLFGLAMGTVLNWHIGRHQQKLKNTTEKFQEAIREMINVISDPMMVCSSINTRFNDLNGKLDELGNKLAKEDSHSRQTITASTSPLEVELKHIRKATSSIARHLETVSEKPDQDRTWGMGNA